MDEEWSGNTNRRPTPRTTRDETAVTRRRACESLLGRALEMPQPDGADRPLLIGDGPAPSQEELPMTAVRDLVLQALGTAD